MTSGAARTALLYVLPAALVTVSWLGLEDPERGGRAAVAALCALAPALIRPVWGRIVAAFAVAIVILPGAFGLSPLRAGDYGHLPARFRDGLLAFYDVRVPFDPSVHPRMHGVVILATLAFCLGIGLAIAARRPLLASMVMVAGAAWPATIQPSRNELLLGGFLLAGVLLLFSALRPRPGNVSAPALVAGGAVLVAALAACAAPAVAKSAFLKWERWDLHHPGDRPVSASFVWNSRYDGIRFPKKITTVLRITGPARSLYWRATVLDTFNGYGWSESGLHWIEPRENGGQHVLVEDGGYPPEARNRALWIAQRIEVKALEDSHLIGASVPVAYATEPGKSVQYAEGGIASGRIAPGDRYFVWSYAPEPGPKELVNVRARYPAAILDRDLRVGGVRLPRFGVPARDAQVEALFAREASDDRFGPYRPLFEQARRLVGNARSPYQIAVALELWLRSAGGFKYEEQPRQAPGLPPLVGFVTRTKAGYCQHFAGAMALMLRYLGIPARVAAGFTSGTYDVRSRSWMVTDHDAHTWVEAWFDGYGWLPFDPTPGRGSLEGTYTASSRRFDASGTGELAKTLGTTPQALQDRIRRAGVPEGTTIGGRRGGGASSTLRDHGPGLAALLLLAALAAIGAIVLAKLVVRRLRYVSHDPRRVAAACRRELLDFLRDQRLEPSPGATLRELEGTLRDELSVAGGRFAEATTAARFAPPERAAAEARRSRRELRLLLGDIRRRLTTTDRIRGLLSLRSLGFR